MYVNLWAPIGILLVVLLFFIVFFKRRDRLNRDNTGDPGSAVGL